MSLPTTKCTGCAACYNICQKNAISMIENKEGFKYPHIDKDKCIGCGLCETTCPIITPVKKNPESDIVFAGWNLDNNVRLESSSGGVFSVLAEMFIKHGGVVFGASLEDNLTDLKHIKVDYTDELVKLRKSKYFQSEISYTYRQVKSILERGIMVLFSGTPCQIAGLKSFLRGKYADLLYTVEILCHGVPSKKVIYKYILSLENKYNKKIVSINFRHKDDNHSWKVSCCCCCCCADGTVIYDESTQDSLFWSGYLNNLFLRESCGQCQFCSKERVADITLGDYWGIWEDNRFSDNIHDGISLIVVNSPQGGNLLNLAEGRIELHEGNKKIAYDNNLTFTKPFPSAPQRKYFFEHFVNQRYDHLIKACFRAQFLKLRVKKILGNHLSELIGRVIHNR